MNGTRWVRRWLPSRGAGLVAALAIGLAAGVGTTTSLVGGRTTTVQQTVAAAQPSSLERAAALSPTAIFAKDAAGVVDIVATTTSTDPWGRSGTAESEGSGFVIDTAGHIVTNQHVVAGATSITVTFKDGTKAKATIVGTGASADLAVVRVHVASSKLTPLTLANSSTVKTGDAVVAIGSPYGYRESITAGIVSAVGRTIEAPNGATIANAIQTDAAINSGNSGGPLINTSGEVIGVNAQIASGSGGNDGVGFAIASNTVKSVVAKILGGEL